MRRRGARWHGGVRVNSRITTGACAREGSLPFVSTHTRTPTHHTCVVLPYFDMHLTWMRNRTWKNRVGARASRAGSAGPRLFRAGPGWCRGELQRERLGAAANSRERLGAGELKERKTYSMCLKHIKIAVRTTPLITLINKQTHKHHLPSAAHRSSRSRHTARRSLPLARALSLSAMDLNVRHIVTLRTAPGACECDRLLVGALPSHHRQPKRKPPPTSERAPPTL